MNEEFVADSKVWILGLIMVGIVIATMALVFLSVFLM